MKTFRLPDLGEGLREAEIIDWHVSVGDHVVADQPLVSVETDKAVVEIPSPWPGRIAQLHGEPGDIAKVGAPLVDYGGEGARRSQSVVGQLPREEPAPRRLTPSLDKPSPISAAPAARALARELGVELGGVFGTGPDGTITAADVRQTAKAAGCDGAGEVLSGPRRAMARAMTRARAEVVPATLTADADVTAWTPREDPTVRLLQAVSAGCRVERGLNAWFDSQSERLERHVHVDIGIAMDTPDGLFVPVLRAADTLLADKLRHRLDELKQKVAARAIKPEDLKDATITLSNFGTLAGRHASLVVRPPQVSILGAGVIEERVCAIDDAPEIRTILPLSLTFDHRVVTGGEAARFLNGVITSLERPKEAAR